MSESFHIGVPCAWGEHDVALVSDMWRKACCRCGFDWEWLCLRELQENKKRIAELEARALKAFGRYEELDFFDEQLDALMIDLVRDIQAGGGSEY